jgi:hypothetical protein
VFDTSISLRHPADYSPVEGARFEVHLEKARGVHGDAARPFEARLEVRDGAAVWTTRELEDANRARVQTLLDDGLSGRDRIDLAPTRPPSGSFDRNGGGDPRGHRSPRLSHAEQAGSRARRRQSGRYGGDHMSRPPRVPARGDVTAAAVAELLGLSLSNFEERLSLLRDRNFPEPDPTTGLYCVEAVDRWRLRRHPTQFPELTTVPAAAHAGAVFDERLRRLDG